MSCPNVKTGLDIGADPRQLEEVVRAVRPRTSKPLIVKLTPNAADVPACALAAEAGGADAVSLINTLRAMALAPVASERRGRDEGVCRPGAPAVAGRRHRRPVGSRDPRGRARPGGGRRARVRIPVIGMGGVSSAAHARDLLDVGATLVAVGTESFRDPAAGGPRIARRSAGCGGQR